MVDDRREGERESVEFELDGVPVTVDDDGSSLLDALRGPLGVRSVKDGCSPQGQCGCCTVLIDGAPRVSCVTPTRRVAGRSVTTLAGLDGGRRDVLAGAFLDAGASQCGFCTPGILVRLAALDPAAPVATVERALAAHLCRCTGWRTILEAWDAARPTATPVTVASGRSLVAARERASIEGGGPQDVGLDVVLGRARFADDTAPADALVAVPDGSGGWVTGETLAEARRAAGKVQGRRTTAALRHPIEVPDGDWLVTLRTSWVEPAYLETDASWCVPGGEPASPLANGGAFGAKVDSPAPAAARALADQHGRAVRVVLAREDVVRLGPKRPPVAAGIAADGSGVLRVVRTSGIAQAIAAIAPGLVVEEVEVAGPPTSAAIRAAGWAEAVVLLAGAQHRAGAGPPVPAHSAVAVSPDGTVEVHVAGALVRARVDGVGVHLRVNAGDPLDEVVLRSYCVGAAHMALSWVRREAIAVDVAGEPLDLTIRSFGILRAADMPAVEVEIVGGRASAPPVAAGDAVFAAVAAAEWVGQGCPPEWPTDR